MAKKYVDWNPDREGFVDHRWEVIKATTRDLPSINVDGKEMQFGREGAFRVSDPGVAAAIRQTYAQRGDVTVTRVRYPHQSDRGHRYFFGSMPEMPWKKEVEHANKGG
jgi:hypothetical protein